MRWFTLGTQAGWNQPIGEREAPPTGPLGRLKRGRTNAKGWTASSATTTGARRRMFGAGCSGQNGPAMGPSGSQTQSTETKSSIESGRGTTADRHQAQRSMPVPNARSVGVAPDPFSPCSVSNVDQLHPCGLNPVGSPSDIPHPTEPSRASLRGSGVRMSGPPRRIRGDDPPGRSG